MTLIRTTAYACDLCEQPYTPEEAREHLKGFAVDKRWAIRDKRHYVVHTPEFLQPDIYDGSTTKHLCGNCIQGIHNVWVQDGIDWDAFSIDGAEYEQ